ncbi:radical SAM family heme chaperone HemW [Prochlorococcus marinus]|uniref:radical SAM family heme chaperone HemW n=1 Tax=Prochlorococcus marinus TaxID=1219 RepID=UPI0022B508B0|nr:radical SAM family heme chaperone HemW [Prochlorococcus marinus]
MDCPISAYLHIPFCHRRCFYCDFPIVPLGDRAGGELGPGSNSIKAYLKLLHREIDLFQNGSPLSTVYIGGGTPSLLTSSQLFKLLDHLKRKFGLQYGAEITLEIDPASFDQNSLIGFLDAGVNRISLGAQSFDNNVLAQLGRRHNSKNVFESCNWINESFRKGDLFSWSLDLIQNLPEQTLIDWKNQLMKAINFSPPHLSIYDLSIEKGTVFDWRKKRGELSLPSQDLAADMSMLTSETLRKEGFSRYEISNYALPGHSSRHNRVYWSGAEWLGFGQGATSYFYRKRFSRPKTREGYKRWIEQLEKQGIKSFFEKSNEVEKINLDDLLIVGLRRREGVNIGELLSQWGWDKKQVNENLKSLKRYWKKFIDMGLLKQNGTRFKLTDPEGMELSNQILVEMLFWWDSLSDSPNL